jgi:hypothetical protein
MNGITVDDPRDFVAASPTVSIDTIRASRMGCSIIVTIQPFLYHDYFDATGAENCGDN